MNKMTVEKSNWLGGGAYLLLLAALVAAPFFFLKSRSAPPLVIQNFFGPVQVFSVEQKAWGEPERGQLLKVFEKIRTGPAGEADLRNPEKMRLRLKENSEIDILPPRFFEKTGGLRLKLFRGTVLGITIQRLTPGFFEISTSKLSATAEKGMFLIKEDLETGESFASVLNGFLKVRGNGAGVAWKVVRPQEKMVATEAQGISGPNPVSREEWNEIKEAYQLVQINQEVEARQQDLSKEAGNLFQFVFDQGTFYAPDFGFAQREFFKDPLSGEVWLSIEYDVFPTSSMAGVYLKTRGLDLSKFSSFEFEAKGVEAEGIPAGFRVELKAESVLRAYALRNLTQKWQTFQYPLNFKKPTSISEITLLFANDKVGEYKQGSVLLRNFKLLSREETTPA